ncbi:RNA recognition motif domain-containing protein [Ditylenchus destructor]|uniref:RNA recognition motif domain-containing protein n=1 Tax=Ditylenchus destructor TaxID=166010 RepID=A0AAD4N0I8_9BILA|nr:RNA recognition motif domain-containing protein [Ditylenchus destructor]
MFQLTQSISDPRAGSSAMLLFLRPSRIHINQLSNNRRQICAFTSTIPIQRNVNHEETRKLSLCASSPRKYDSVPFKEELLSSANRRYCIGSFKTKVAMEVKVRFELPAMQPSLEASLFCVRDGPGTYDDPRTVFVTGLSKDTTVHSLRQYFIKKNLDVANCRIARNKKTGDSLKYGFVEFATVEQAELASKERPFIDYKNVSVQMSGNKDLDDKYRIFVGGLLKVTSGATLHHHFSKFGDIFACYIVRDDDNLSKGFGYVTYKSQDSLDRALNSQPHSIDNKVVFVKHTSPRSRELTLFIGNLSPKSNDESLKEHFSNVFQLDRALKDQPHVIDGVEVKINYQTSELDLVVDSLPRNISEASLKKSLLDLFSRYGQVRECRFIKNSAGTTTAFVALSSKDEVSRALADRPHRISGKLINTHQKGAEFALIVHGLPKNTTDEDLYETFSKAGKLVHWQVKRDRKNKTNRPLGYGFVSFSTAEEVARAIENQPYYINGTMLKIERRYEIYKEYER